ncbi:MAG: CapA family protein [Cyclobacteriaceae bacterium]
MNLRHAIIYFSAAFLFLWGCKSTQSVSGTSDSTQDLAQIAADSADALIEPAKEYLITLKGDTLTSLYSEVEIETHRLLPDTVSISAVGDIMMGTKFPNSSYLPSENGEYLWDHVRASLSEADITFGNLEGTVLDGEGDPKKCSNPAACYLFKMPTRLTSNLVDCGFDLLSLANNHANDFGLEGRISTQKTLDSIGVAYAGSTETPFVITKIGHLKVGFIGFAPNKGTVGFYDIEYARNTVAHLDTLSDIVIVSIHGGAEGAKNMHVTRETEYYYGENRGNIYDFSHQMIDMGADVILGHGPHVVRGIELYKNRLIAYSLGNFLTYGRFNLRGVAGEAPLLNIKTKNDGTFISGEIESYYQSYELGPRVDSRKRAMTSIRKLSEEDFPENEIMIDDEGRILYLQN